MKRKITTNGTIKSLARDMFKGHFLEGFLLVIMVQVFTSVPAFLITFFAPESEILAWINDFYVIFISGPLQFGLAIFFLCNFREQRIGINAIMHGFDFYLKAVSVFVSVALRVVIGLFLFIIPGIIAAISYSQAMFILVDDPNKSAAQCLAESKKMMKGNQLNLISFYLSYILVFIIATIPTFILAWFSYDPSVNLVANPDYIFETSRAMLLSPWSLVCEGITLLALTYLDMGQAAFYDIYSGNLVFETASDSIDVQEI